ncbi:MAG: glucose 1-dehydrogenase [Bacillota bacterium]|jgi:NAD(P)-dependent dehydrogenase (short-subunit alcohol dehydrogenase family)
MKLQNKVALITGVGSGMGEAMAKMFAREGAKVVGVDINQEAIDRVISNIRETGGTVLGVKADISQLHDVENMINSAVEEYGRLDILVNNAGIMDNFVPVAELSEELWDRVMNVNTKGPFLACRAALKVMLKQETGVIINNASVGGLFGARGGAAYVASKHALIGLTKNIGAVYNDQGIRCVAIAPGGVKTNIALTLKNPNKLGAGKLARGVGPAPMGEPEQIAALALFLASDDASFINGTVIVADGGWTAY